MQKVWKFVLDFGEKGDVARIQVPIGSVFLHFAEQQGQFCVWYLVNPTETEKGEVDFRIAVTGHPIEQEHLIYMGSTLTMNGSLVFHLFQL